MYQLSDPLHTKIYTYLFSLNSLSPPAKFSRLSMLILPLFFLFFHVEAQSPFSQDDLPSTSQDVGSNIQPSLAVVVGILAIMFSLTFVLLAYAKLCHRGIFDHATHQNRPDSLVRSGSRYSGIDKTVIESLPFFRFSSLRGSREGLECPVCLSKFEDIEILRLLPKCKHAFHVNCVDQWLEKHSSCPLCRQKVGADDLTLLTFSNSLRFLSEPPPDDSNVELFVQIEENRRGGSSRFSGGINIGSFRKSGKVLKEEEAPIQENGVADDDGENQETFHKFNHRIIVPDVVLKNRWSNVSSSDLMFLNSEMLGAKSNNRFSSIHRNDEQLVKIKADMEMKSASEKKIHSFTDDHQSKANSSYASRVLSPNDKRSMSEITVHPRFTEVRYSSSLGDENGAMEERMKRLWLPIARRTVQWFANRENRPHNTRQSLNV
ncbi:E3 ubiquitin-protein ligase ATL42-like [Diospyros lotus]|uniref:E3 ubiquitin-protein ligase ATL42-like n=1 Tax=Diospyros lotus TaxID=55363 RepID=UPI00225B48EF|nr:E3 ubiquitin-protein ligase ATL42-like [Diospyros lotus]